MNPSRLVSLCWDVFATLTSVGSDVCALLSDRLARYTHDSLERADVWMVRADRAEKVIRWRDE